MELSCSGCWLFGSGGSFHPPSELVGPAPPLVFLPSSQVSNSGDRLVTGSRALQVSSRSGRGGRDTAGEASLGFLGCL